MKGGSSDWVIRPASRHECDVALEGAAQEGWSPGRSDAQCFHVTDPEGFLLAFRDAEPVASISVVRYGSDFGFLGLYIVRPGLRGRGYCYRLWQAADGFSSFVITDTGRPARGARPDPAGAG